MLLQVNMVSFCTVIPGIIQESDSDFSICMLLVNTSDKQPYIVSVVSG